jgi:biopolymer transport protein ExbD
MAGDSGGGGGGKGSRATAGRVTSRMRTKGGAMGGGLMLASMLDILMAILFFLLKNYSTVVSDFSMGKDISLPQSSSMVPPAQALQLVVTQHAVILDDKELFAMDNGDVPRAELYRDGITIVKLAQALKEQKDRSMFIQQHNDQHSFTGTIVMQADKNLRFNVLKKVIYTAGIADFVNLKLAVLKKDDT